MTRGWTMFPGSFDVSLVLANRFGVASVVFVALAGCSEGLVGSDDEVGDDACSTTGLTPDGEWSDLIDWDNAGNLYDPQDPGVLLRKPGYEAPTCIDDEDCQPVPGPGSYCMSGVCGDIQPHHDYLTAIHLIHMPTGELLMFHGQHDERVWTIGEPPEDMRWFPVPHHVNLATGTGYPDIFCSGHILLPNGHPLIAGGNINGNPAFGGLNAILSFDPDTANPNQLPYGWIERTAELEEDRWYPTLTVLADGRVLISGGASRGDGVNTFELYDPVTDDVEKLDVEFMWGEMSLYPLMFQLPNGDVLFAGGENAAGDGRHGRILVPGPTAGDWKWAEVDEEIVEITSTINGASGVMYAPGKIMKSGGAAGGGLSSAITEVIDLSTYASDDYSSNMNWTVTDSMNQPRHFHTLTLLPDGRVLATGGNTYGNAESWEHHENSCDSMELSCSAENCPFARAFCDGGKCTVDSADCTAHTDCGAPCVDDGDCPDDAEYDATCSGNGKCIASTYGWSYYCIGATGKCSPLNNACFATKTAEIWDPDCQEWTELDPQMVPRMYHSTAALLPDGRVVSTGGGHRPNAGHDAMEEQHNIEYFEPVYGSGTKPEYTFEVSNDPPYMSYNQDIYVFRSSQSSPSTATLVKLAAVTHGFDQGQMIIPLDFEHIGGDMYKIGAPFDSVNHTAAATAPPGYYMLFLRANSGVISTGQYIRVGDQSADKWSCIATQQLAASETVCDTTPVNGACPTGYESQEPVSLPVLNPTQGSSGWEVVAPPGMVENPLSPSLSEIDEILGQCALACEQQWASVPEISANCASSGVFQTPQLLEQDVDVTRDLIAVALQDGSGIFSSASLSCSLSDSCCLEFDELLCNATNQRPTTAEAPQDGPAEYEVTLATTSTLTIDTPTQAVINLSGEAGYGFCSTQTSGACPFYLDHLDMAGGTGTTQVLLVCDDSTTALVNVSALEIRLTQPAFGIAAGTGDIGFPIGGLIFETSLMVNSVPYSFRRPITASVTGTAAEDNFTMSDLDVDLTVPCNTSTATVTATLDLAAGSAVAESPSISITLPSSPACSTAMNLVASYSDPDNDIVSVRWRMDGVLLNPTVTQVVPTGAHTLTAIATDSRGATTTTTETFQCN